MSKTDKIQNWFVFTEFVDFSYCIASEGELVVLIRSEGELVVATPLGSFRGIRYIKPYHSIIFLWYQILILLYYYNYLGRGY